MSQTQSTRDISIATLLRRIKEMEATNAHLQTLLQEKRASSPSSSSGEKRSYTCSYITRKTITISKKIYIHIYTCVFFYRNWFSLWYKQGKYICWIPKQRYEYIYNDKTKTLDHLPSLFCSNKYQKFATLKIKALYI